MLASVTLNASDTPDSCTSWGAADIVRSGDTRADGAVSAVHDVYFGDISLRPRARAWTSAWTSAFTCVSESFRLRLVSVAPPSISGMLKA